MSTWRVGQGIDVHPFGEDPDRPLKLGGVPIPGAMGLAGHSDGDALIHAVVDALLGAAGLGDIGTRFGTSDPIYAGADSAAFLTDTMQLLDVAGWRIANVDCTVVAQRPRVGPHREAIRDRLAELLGVASEAVNVKATTTDGLGFVGRAEGITCLTVALLTRAE